MWEGSESLGSMDCFPFTFLITPTVQWSVEGFTYLQGSCVSFSFCPTTWGMRRKNWLLPSSLTKLEEQLYSQDVYQSLGRVIGRNGKAVMCGELSGGMSLHECETESLYQKCHHKRTLPLYCNNLKIWNIANLKASEFGMNPQVFFKWRNVQLKPKNFHCKYAHDNLVCIFSGQPPFSF